MAKTFVATLVALTLAISVGNAFAAGGKHLMWINAYKAAPYAVWHDNATCPNPPAR